MPAKQISHTGNYADPNCSAQKIECQELFPGHPQDSGQRTRYDPHAENESSKENREGSVPLEEPLAERQRGITHVKKSLVAFEQSPATIQAQSKTEVVSGRGGDRAHDNHQWQLQFMSGISQKTGQEQDRLAGYGYTRIFQQQRNRNRPIPVVNQRRAQHLENGVGMQVPESS